MNRKTLLLTSAFLGGSILAAFAQSSGTSSSAGSGSISAATHCLDQATGQPKLKTASSGSGSSYGSGSSSSGMSGSGSSGSNSAGMNKSPGSTTGSAGASGSSAANLPPC